jgi:hypothetical protein
MVPAIKNQRVRGDYQKPVEETGSESNNEMDLYHFLRPAEVIFSVNSHS